MQVLKNFFTYVDDLDTMLKYNSNSNNKISAKEFREILNKITGDKVSNSNSSSSKNALEFMPGAQQDPLATRYQ